MNVISQDILISLFYSIKTDNAQDFKLDKIDFLNKITKQFFDSLEVDEVLQVKGLFGTQKEVEREIQFLINQEVTLQPYLSNSDMGNLIAIKFQNDMIFCFVLSETFFVTRPINEKAVEIVLFRILQDLTDNIKFCLSDAIFKENWYQGDVIPFSQIQQRTEYHFAESENNDINVYECNWMLFSNNIILNSQTLSPVFTRQRQITFNQGEMDNFNSSFNYFLIQLTNKILHTKNKQTTQLMKIFKLEHQSKNLKIMLDKLSDDLEKEIIDLINYLIKEVRTSWADIFKTKNKLEEEKKIVECQINNLLQIFEVYYQKGYTYNRQSIEENYHQFDEQMKKFFDKLIDKMMMVRAKYREKKQDIIQELRKQTTYELEIIRFKLSRVDDNEIGKVSIISQIKDYQILNSNILQLESYKFLVKDYFETKEKGHIYIIISENEKGVKQTLIYFNQYNTSQIQAIKQFDFQNTEQAVFFYDQNKGHLYIFNFRKKIVLQIIVSARGQIQSEQSIYYQQEHENTFLVSHVAYLKMVNKFIVLSDDKQVYKQKDQGEEFEKCRIQSQNGGIEQKDLEQGSCQDQKYNQLIGCPSGKYFYLANDNCCDRYDANFLKIERILIQGPIKIFADFSDVIILGQFSNHQEGIKKAKIISNLITSKKFNKKEDNQQQVIGNPAFDIAKGAFIKFGPNSKFLLKEKNSTISLNVNNDYYNIVKSYLNIMKVNEIILSSSQLQSAQFKCAQIKDIIFSRVPLQLCTIENTNLIPLNDGFRQDTQTQTLTSIEQKVKQLHLGFLEEHLFNYKNKIFVVGIIGKQSSGKSYLLNRVFGTRFAVSSARCTDGVWASIAYIAKAYGARSDKEEIKMLAFLTALCDITILNSDLTFNRHFNDLFTHLVEASKQLNDEKLFKGILYFVLRDVSSQDNAGAEQELLKNLERLKEGGSEDIIFLKRLFNNKIAIQPLVNYEIKLFDEQIDSLRKYFLEQSAISNHWNSGRELIQIMKILLCQLELSDNTNASLIDLQILIEKIFEDNQELWYDFTSNEVQDSNLKLVQSDYKFPKFETHYLSNKHLLKLLYENLITEDIISTHNKNLLQVRTQFNLMMKQRKEQIIQRAQQETNSINNPEVKEIIQKNLSMLNIFLKDQIKQYQFCEDKCVECYLQCKQFKNHIEISQTLMSKLDDEIHSLEVQQKKSNIKDKSEVQEKRDRIDKIKEEIKKAEDSLGTLKILNKIFEIKQKLSFEKDAMEKYDFYDSEGECINTRVFQMTQPQTDMKQAATPEDIENLQTLFENELIRLQNNKEWNIKEIQQSTAGSEQLNLDLNQYLQDIKLIEIHKQELKSYKQEISQQKLNAENELSNVQSEIQKISIEGDEMDIQNLQVIFEVENQNLLKIQDELQNQFLIYDQHTMELEGLLKMDEKEQIQYVEQLEQEINEYLEKQSQLEEEVEALKKKKRDLEDIRSKLQNENSKKVGKNNNKIEELSQKLKQFDEQQINEQISLCDNKQRELEKNFQNFENSEIYNNCQEDMLQEQVNQIDSSKIEKLDMKLETNELEMNTQQFNTLNQQEQNSEIQCKQKEKSQMLKIFNLFLSKKKEKVNENQVNKNALQKEIQCLKNKIDNINQMIKEKIKKNNLLDISDLNKSDIREFTKKLEDQDQKLILAEEKLIISQENYESTTNKLNYIKKENIELECENDQIDQQISQLNGRLKQVKMFSENLNEYIILKTTLQEEEIKLKQLADFQSINNVQQLELQRTMEKLETQIDNLKEEKGSLSNQLTTYNQIALLEKKLQNLQNQKQKFVEQQIQVHSCQRKSHGCDQNCKVCPDEKCDHKAGHDEKQEHLCNKQDHRCQDTCQIINCKRKCMKSFNHDRSHKCGNDHPCNERCNYCHKKCKIDCSNSHSTNHNCLDNYCTHNCELCSRKCCQPHAHSQKQDSHFCEDVHNCQEFCQEDGICKIDYMVVLETWETKLSNFKYNKYIQIDTGKQKCQKLIPVGCNKHQGKHLCKEKSEKQFHQCTQQCPECNVFCDQQYGHFGSHQSDRHRNKEKQIFTTQEGNQFHFQIQDQKDLTFRKYEIGDSSAPETCDQSCKRKGRAHFHLIKCEGGKGCLQKKNELKARHSKEKYVKFERLNFDEVLCEDFWKLKNWIHPIKNELENITKCNYFCPLCIQQNGVYQFCDNNAWHTKDDKINAHSFSCVESHLQHKVQGINIAFVIDSTISMGDYIKMSKATIKEIMQKCKSQFNINGQKINISFAAVSYSDHQSPYQASQKIIDVQDFSSDTDVISFLNKIVLQNGFDHPEAVLDGLEASLGLDWNPKYEKLLYLIADTPPHGRQYHNYQSENFPKGCPCGLNQLGILRKLQNMNIKFKILKLNQNLEMMIAEFKKDYADIQVLTTDLIEEVLFKNLIVKDVCRFLVQNEITYQMKNEK